MPGCTTRRLLARSRFNDVIPARPLYSPQGNHLRGVHGTDCVTLLTALSRENMLRQSAGYSSRSKESLVLFRDIEITFTYHSNHVKKKKKWEMDTLKSRIISHIYSYPYLQQFLFPIKDITLIDKANRRVSSFDDRE